MYFFKPALGTASIYEGRFRHLYKLFFAFLLSATVSFGQQIPDQKSGASLDKLLLANAYPFKIQNGTLSGEGAKVLASSMNEVQFVALGEWHNRRAVHKFGGALFRMLHDRYGFNYQALEEDPYLGKLSSRASRRGGAEAMIKLALRYPNAFHLLTEEQLEMMGDIGRRSEAAAEPIWGLNQVFGATHIYERLVQIAPDAKARSAARKLLNEALEYEKERFQKNIHYVAVVAKPSDFASLRNAFRPKAGSEAEWLIDQIELSNQVFSPYVTKPRPAPEVFHRSGVKRETNMKLLFADRYREAQSRGDRLPKVLAMFGHLHLYRGLSEQTDLYTLGNFLSELAIFNGQRSLHIYTVVDLPEVRRGWHGTLVEAIENAGDKTDDGIVVDLRPLRSLALTRNPASAELDPALRRLFLGYDFFVYLRDGKLGSLERLKTPNFRMYSEEN